jgi:hypothetical protein
MGENGPFFSGPKQRWIQTHPQAASKPVFAMQVRPQTGFSSSTAGLFA